MEEVFNNSKLEIEEKKAIKVFIWLFYIVFLTYEILNDFIFASALDRKPGIPNGGLGYWYYVIVFSLIPLGLYILKRGNPYAVKYIFFIGYTAIDLTNLICVHLEKSFGYQSGNLVEVFFLLFSPLFINKRYFFLVAIGMNIKYIILGIVFSEPKVLFPITIQILFSMIAYVLLNRFMSYLKTITSIYSELRQKEKLAVIGQMAAAIGHEIRNPLASLRGFTQLQNERYPNTNDYYPIMIQEIDRINSIVTDLMYLGKPKMIHFEKTSIEEIMAYTLSVIQQQAERQKVMIETIIKGPLPPIDCDGQQLKQVFFNLIKNSIEAMTDGGTITISINVCKDQNKMLISIQDQGCGIGEEHITNLGEPFYTTKRDGHGLGLMVTNQIIKDHKGELHIQSHIGKGTKISVVLPIQQL